jgi:hypothetical protein
MISLVNLLDVLEPALCLAVLLLLIRSGQFRSYIYVAGFLATRSLSSFLLLLLLHPIWLRHVGLFWSVQKIYVFYFAVYWSSYAIEAALELGIIYNIYRLAMAPLEGLRELGMIVFRWAMAISVALAVAAGFGPHFTSASFVVHAVSQLQQTQSVLTLSMLLFVCFTIKPLGLSYRSRMFGICLGLGVMAATDLLISGWMTVVGTKIVPLSVVSGFAVCIGLGTWSAYFAVPEPKRRLILLPTTSPFFRWNQISEVLNDEPGYVAIGEVTLDMFAPAEVEIMRRASAKM